LISVSEGAANNGPHPAAGTSALMFLPSRGASGDAGRELAAQI